MDFLLGMPAAEDVSTTSAGVAQHWAGVYRNLASFDHTLGQLKGIVGPLTGDRRREASRQALPALLADAERFRERFDFWEVRLGLLR
ncbi:MAG: hypothetical protein M3077_02960 [Candidatus Dormibacteraeota bacterium]|nr:hypothetical protein [Candidatus Dormibacteraeota bacterium]